MNSWFTVKVKYTKQLENGTFKRVSEPYMLAAMTFTDAEARIYEELGALIRGEFTVVGIARTDVHDIFAYDDAETWFKCKVTYDKIDDEGDKKKTISQNYLVTASNVKEAYLRIEESLATSIWLDLDPLIGYQRVIDRDGENISREMTQWLVMQEQHFAADRTKERCEFLLST